MGFFLFKAILSPVYLVFYTIVFLIKGLVLFTEWFKSLFK